MAKTKLTFDVNGIENQVFVEKECETVSKGNKKIRTTKNGRTCEMDLDDAGRTVHSKYFGKNGNALVEKWSEYNSKGMLTKQIEKSEKFGLVEISWNYDENGFVTDVEESITKDGAVKKSEALMKITLNDDGTARSEPVKCDESLRELYGCEKHFDVNGNCVKTLSVDGEELSEREFDSEGKIVYQKFNSSVEHYYSYDDEGNKSTRVEKNGKVICNNTTFWSDDHKYKIKKVEDFQEKNTKYFIHEYERDENGNVSKDIRYVG